MKSRLFAIHLSLAALIALSAPAAFAHAEDGGGGEHENGDSHDGSGHGDRESTSDRSGSGHEGSGHDGSGHGGSGHEGSGGAGGSHSSEGAGTPHEKGEGKFGFLRQDGEDRKAPKNGRGRPAAHDSARVAVTSGAVVPYKDVLRHLEQQGAGRVLHVQLTIGSVRSIYELKVEDKQGNISTVTVDAGTGAILSGGGN